MTDVWFMGSNAAIPIVSTSKTFYENHTTFTIAKLNIVALFLTLIDYNIVIKYIAMYQ